MSYNEIIFQLKLPNGEIIFLPPKSTITSYDIYKYVKKYTKDDLILFLDTIPIPKNEKINLIDIGYDPYQLLYMKPNIKMDCLFVISKYEYTYKKEIQSYQTICDIKTIFAEEFMTIAQNIIIKKNSNILPDDTNIMEKDEFEIDVVEGYSLFKVFFSKFIFICLPNDSTFKNLKETLAGYGNHFYTDLKIGPYLEQLSSTVPQLDDHKIIEFSEKIELFDFQFFPSNVDNIKDFKINIKSNNNELLFKYEGLFHCRNVPKQPSNVINSIKCFLEKQNHIDRESLILSNDEIQKNSISFSSPKNLYARLHNRKEVFPYLITIKDLRKKYCCRVGIVINGRFVYDDSEFLAKYLSSPNSEQSPIKIEIVRPKTDCCIYEIQSKKNTKLELKSFIIPNFFTFNQIMTVYYKMKPNSMQFFPGFYMEGSSSNSPLDNTSRIDQANSTQFYAVLAQNFVINYHFESEKKDYSIEMSNTNRPQVKDFLFEIAKKHKKPSCIYDVYIKEKRINFWEFLAEFAGQSLSIKEYIYQPEIESVSEKFIKVYDTRNDIYFIYKSDINNVTVKNIIQIMTEKDNIAKFSIYMNFHKLSPEDKPIILYQPYDFIILSENKSEKEIHVSNGNQIDYIMKVDSFGFPIISAILINDFGLDDTDVQFILEIPDSHTLEQKEYILPHGFDAGCLPKISKIMLEYVVPESNLLTFCYLNDDKETIQSMISLSDTKKPIKTLKKEIISKMKIFNISPLEAVFEFLGVELNQCKTFSYYKITKNSPIIIKHKKNSSKVEVRLFNDFKLGYYFVKNVGDLIDVLKQKYGIDEPDYNLRIYNKADQNSLLDDESKVFKNGDVVFASFEKIKIRLLEPNGKRIEFDEIIKPTEKFIKDQILPEIHKDSSEHLIFYKREDIGHYVPIDCTKTFKEEDNRQFFLFKRLSDLSFYFMGNEIKLNNELLISEYESIRSIIDNYLKDVLLLSPSKRIELYTNSVKLNHRSCLKDFIAEGIKIEIRLLETNEVNNDEKSKRKKIKLSSFKPKVTKNFSLSSHNKNDDENKADKVVNNNHEAPIENDVFFVGVDNEIFFKTIEKIGEGETFNSYKIIDTRTNTTMCKKVVKFNNKKSILKLQQIVLLEFDISSIIKHPCICKLYGISFSEKIKNDIDEEVTTTAIYLEYLEYKLDDFLRKNVENYTMKTKIVVEIAHGMSFLHKHKIIHRDLKIQNILLDKNLNAKVVDFGVAKINELNSENDMYLTKKVGSVSFMSPEMENGNDYDYKTDVYSFGIVLYYIFVGELPKRKKDDDDDELFSFSLPKPSDSISNKCIDLISWCLSYDKIDRPTFDEILEFIRSNSYSLASNVDKEIVENRDIEIIHFENDI